MENMIWNKNKECMSREELRDLQGKRLHKLVDLVYHNTPFYRAKMQEMDLLPDDIRTIDDRDSPYPCLFRHDGQSHHRRLYLS